jgi:amino-acid N-acetyltransferase
VLPQAQGDGTVDFLWVALRDETYGLGLQDAANSNQGSLGGVGQGRDLVWRSRADNPVNKWYFERSSGFVTRGTWKMFWCDAEERMRKYAHTQGDDGARIVMCEEKGRLERWGPVIERIPSAWSR